MDDLVRPGLRVLIAGTISRRHRLEREHYYAGAGNRFWWLLVAAGLVPDELTPERDHELLAHGIGLTDLVHDEGEPDLDGLLAVCAAAAPRVVAFVSKTAASAYARAAGESQPRGYGATVWDVAGAPGFVLPGPSGANNAMPLPLRAALWRDLADFLETLR